MDTTLIPPGTVVVGVDGSPNCERALDWAVDHALRERRQLTLAHGIDPAAKVWLDPSGTSHREIVEAMHHDGLAVLRKAREHVHAHAPELSVHDALWLSDPRVTLLELGERASLVVVGSRGRGPVTSLLLGSVGLAVSRHAPCPVVVVRPHHPGVVRRGVLVGIDATERCRPVLEFGYRQASLRGLPLTILHATSAWDAGVEVAEAVAGLAEKFPDVRVATQVVHEDPAAVLARESERMDLVVLGAHHGGSLRGSVTNAVVEHAASPVAVVPLPMAGSDA